MLAIPTNLPDPSTHELCVFFTLVIVFQKHFYYLPNYIGQPPWWLGVRGQVVSSSL